MGREYFLQEVLRFTYGIVNGRQGMFIQHVAMQHNYRWEGRPASYIAMHQAMYLLTPCAYWTGSWVVSKIAIPANRCPRPAYRTTEKEDLVTWNHSFIVGRCLCGSPRMEEGYRRQFDCEKTIPKLHNILQIQQWWGMDPQPRGPATRLCHTSILYCRPHGQSWWWLWSI